jgi:hypothetical protein
VIHTSSAWYRRWAVFGPCVAVSLLPALLLTISWANPDNFTFTLGAFWVELLAGPVKYWTPVLAGHPNPYALHPMSGVSTGVYAVCFLLTLAHPVRPRQLTGWVTAAAFCVWYLWAFGRLNAFEF